MGNALFGLRPILCIGTVAVLDKGPGHEIRRTGLFWIDGVVVAAELEVEMGAGDPSGRARQRDRLRAGLLRKRLA